jgi:hypothetical protein
MAWVIHIKISGLLLKLEQENGNGMLDELFVVRQEHFLVEAMFI